MFIFKYFTRKFKADERQDGLEYSSSSSRYMSLLFDLFILVLLLKVFYSVCFFFFPFMESSVDSQLLNKYKFNLDLSKEELALISKLKTKYLLIQLVGLGFVSSYFILSWYYLSGSIGNMIFGLRVLSEDKNGCVKKLSLGTCFLRLFGCFVTCLTLFIGFFMLFFNKKRMALYDKIAKTIVVTNSSLRKILSLEQGGIEEKSFSNKFIRFDVVNHLILPAMKRMYLKVKSKFFS